MDQTTTTVSVLRALLLDNPDFNQEMLEPRYGVPRKKKKTQPSDLFYFILFGVM